MTRVSRPYSRGSIPSVTTILGELDKGGGLAWAAARETATYAVKHRVTWENLSDEKAIDLLYRHHRGVWDSRAAVGTITHSVFETYADDGEVDLDALVASCLRTPKAKLLREETPAALRERILGYVLGVEKFLEDHIPANVRAEIVVRTPGIFVGTTDYLATITASWPSDGFQGIQRTALDLKTTANQDKDKGFYYDSYSLQLHAYAFADEEVVYEGHDEVGTKPWTKPDRLAILHLRGDENYELYEIPIKEETYQMFLNLAAIHAWRKALPKTAQRIA